MKFRVQGSEFRVKGSGFRVKGSGFRVQSEVLRVYRKVDCQVRPLHVRSPQPVEGGKVNLVTLHKPTSCLYKFKLVTLGLRVAW